MMDHDRGLLVDKQFKYKLEHGIFPKRRSKNQQESNLLTDNERIMLMKSQFTSRKLDLIARSLKAQGASFYTIGSSGHEGNAAIAHALTLDDKALLHYRSGAFFVHRAAMTQHESIIDDVLLSLMAKSADPIASGRHKVFGSVPLNIPPQTSTIASHLPKAVGQAIGLVRARELGLKADDRSIVLASFGDASLNHATALAAINTACWTEQQNYPLPIIFLCEDNGLGISVPTPSDWVASIIAPRKQLTYIEADGLNLRQCYQAASQAVHIARDLRKPVFLHMKCVRLLGHAGSDIETVYRSEEAILADEANDPLLHTARDIIEDNIMQAEEVYACYEAIGEHIDKRAKALQAMPILNDRNDITSSLIPTPKTTKQRIKRKQTTFDFTYQKRTMAQSINIALHEILNQHDEAIIFGEDVAKKGGVYNVTTKLQQHFGPKRVFDTLLDETTILGTALGFASEGLLPIPEIQFLAYLHNAIDQLRGEAATTSFFSNGNYAYPMIVRIAGFAYQKGFGGHFHNDNAIAALREIPGIIVATPSSPKTAALMLHECARLALEKRRTIVFIEPIALYHQKDRHKSHDGLFLEDYPDEKEQMTFGEVGMSGKGNTLAIISYANGHYLAEQAMMQLEELGIDCTLIDLRWLNPLPFDDLLKALSGKQHILIVDECRMTGSISEELMARLYESQYSQTPMKRLCAADCFITLGSSAEKLLPQCEDIVNAARALVEGVDTSKVAP